MKISISRLLLIAAVLVALLTVGIVGYLQWSRPLHLRVAAGPRDGVDATLLTRLRSFARHSTMPGCAWI